MTEAVGRRRAKIELTMDAPWRWLGLGWRDLWRAPVHSLGHGALVVGGGLAVVAGLWRLGLSAFIPVAFGVFALVGPLLAVGLYEISRRQDAGEPVSFGSTLLVRTKSPKQIAMIGFFIMFALLVWGRVAIMLYALFASSVYMPLDDFMGFALSTNAGLAMLVVGTAVGGIIAFAIYLLTVVSIPMLMNEESDIFSAIALGVNAFRDNPGPMLLWAWLIGILTAAGVATLFVGVVLVFPLLGHASWRAYRDIRGLA